MAAIPRSDTDSKEHPRGALFHMTTTQQQSKVSAVIFPLADAREKLRECSTSCL